MHSSGLTQIPRPTRSISDAGTQPDEVLVLARIPIETNPGIPRRHVLDIEEAFAFDFRSAVRQLLVGAVDEQATAGELVSCFHRRHSPDLAV